jgi:catechol-2,3-dioxygenase
MLRQLLEECEKGGFAEVVLMLSNSAASAEVYTMFEDLRFTEDGETVTFMADGGTHLHLKIDEVKSGKLLQTTNNQGLPSYSLWLLDLEEQPLLRVYLRKSDNEETNPPRHDHFMGLIQKYGEAFPITG